MLKRHNQIVSTLFALGDLLGVAFCWTAAYAYVFDASIYSLISLTEPLDFADLSLSQWPEYRSRLPIGIGLALIAFQFFHLYRPRRGESILLELPDLIKACVFWAFLLSVYGYWEAPYREAGPLFSRLFVALLASGLFLWVIVIHVLGRSILRKLRRRGYNLRHILIVGAGPLGQQVLEKIRENRWTGLRVVGFLDDDPEVQNQSIHGLQVLGSCGDVNEIIKDHGVDQVYVALPRNSQDRLHEVMEFLSVETVDVKIIPDLADFVTLRMSVSDLGGLPLITLQETPLVGWNRVVKRCFDLIVGVICLIVFALPMLIVALLVKLTSKGPIFYTQERMGLDGNLFHIYKFRSMKINAEKETGAVWASKDDDRRTSIGSFLRSSNLDELPQLFNVITGDMSLVGPRPERPVFIQEFKSNVPRYMLRHRMKSGMTGWAQVNGWRGNTSLEKRIQCDLYYIENWSLWLDIRIMIMQIFEWKDENAY